MKISTTTISQKEHRKQLLKEGFVKQGYAVFVKPLDDTFKPSVLYDESWVYVDQFAFHNFPGEDGPCESLEFINNEYEPYESLESTDNV